MSANAMSSKTVLPYSERCYLEPMVNGINRIFLPDGKEIKVSSSSLYDKSCVHLFPSNCTLTLIACYKKQGASLRVEGISTVYLDKKSFVTKDAIHINQSSVLEISPGALIYVLEFTDVNKQCLNLCADPALDHLSLRTRLFRWQMFTGGQLFTLTSAGFDDRRAKVASFDLDRTLIKSKSGGYPKDHTDWTLWHESIPTVFNKLHEDGYKVIIFTNQAGIMKSQSSLNLHSFKTKIENVIQSLGIPVQVQIAAYHGGPYRKPVPGMWRLMEWNCGVKADLRESFFVGDSAGRQQDLSSCDRIFAENVGVRFQTPEEFFLNEQPEPYAGKRFFPESTTTLPKMPNLEIPSEVQEVIIMVGPPSSGKTAFVESYLIPNRYVPVSLDYFDVWDVSADVLADILRRRRSAVIDHRNGTIRDRRQFLHLCKTRQVKVRCFVMEWSVCRCLHNNRFKKMFDVQYESVSSDSLEQYRKTYEAPTVEEGFASVLSIPFIPKFKCDEMKFLYNCYLHAQ